VTDARLYALEEGPFLIALTGHAPALRAVNAVVEDRLSQAGDDPSGSS
jgi:hypothetical protein